MRNRWRRGGRGNAAPPPPTAAPEDAAAGPTADRSPEAQIRALANEVAEVKQLLRKLDPK